MVDRGGQASWHEAEGAKRRIPRRGEEFGDLVTVTQDKRRGEIVKTLCKELKEAGFNPSIFTSNRTRFCSPKRIEEQKCFIENALPHYLARQTKTGQKPS